MVRWTWMYMYLTLNGRNRLSACGNGTTTVLPLPPLTIVIFFKIGVESDVHAEHLLLVDLHPPADGIAIRAVVKFVSFNQIFTTNQQSGTLLPAYRLAAGEGVQVNVHLDAIEQILLLKYIRSRISV